MQVFIGKGARGEVFSTREKLSTRDAYTAWVCTTSSQKKECRGIHDLEEHSGCRAPHEYEHAACSTKHTAGFAFVRAHRGGGAQCEGGGGRQQHLEDIGVGQLLSACSHAVQHEGQVLMVLLPDDMKDAILLREARRDKVINVCKLSYKAVGIVEDLVGVLVSVLAGSHELGAALQQGRSDVLDAHPDLLLHALPVPLHGHSSCRAQVRQQLAMKQSQV